MVYFKVLLDEKRLRADNIYPIVVRVTYNRKNTTFSTGLRLKQDAWDASTQRVKNHSPNSQVLNKTITDFYSKVQTLSLEMVSQNIFSFENLRQRMERKATPQAGSTQVSFDEFASKLVGEMFELNQAGNAIVYQTATNRLLKYCNNQRVEFTQLNYELLEGFRKQLIKDGVKQNSISNYFRTLRAIFNKAIRAKLVDRSAYPFLDLPIKTERTAKRALDIKSLALLLRTEHKPRSPKWHALNYFLLSFSLRGASFTDLAYLTPQNIHKSRLVYRRRKTHKEIDVLLTKPALSMLSRYAGISSKYLLPVLPEGVTPDSKRAKAILSQWIKTTNKWLRAIADDLKIDEEITTYVTRHSWGTTAKRLGFSNELIAECLGHEYGNKITNIYLGDFDQAVIDNVNNKVLGKVLPNMKAGL